MSKIRVMSENLANKIAAGEVVEKCASVVKELVENSIDAGATNIKVNLIDGGLTSINIIDNGSGMDKEDAVLSFSRHATSKIYKDDDLYFIETLGFRGEALASIASVAEVNLETCSKEIGTHVHIKGGNMDIVEPTSARPGTSITITNLFYNTPARLKYLKSEATELNNCVQFIEKLSLSRPDIAFTLTNNDRVVVKTSGSNNLLKTIHEIYGLNVSSNMLEIKASSDDFEITGFVGKPSILKKNRNHFNTIVNGRVVRNNDINRAINDAYNTYKHEGFYPIVVINIETDPTLVDVNIHPTKQDIKMSKIEELTEILYKTIKEALYNNLLIPNAIVDESLNKVDIPFIPLSVYDKDNKVTEVVQTSFDLGTTKSEEETVIKNETFKRLKLYPVGQVHGTYIIAENEDGMFILDQHAAHERVNYEMIKKKFAEETPSYTDMLVPLQIELTTSDYEAFMENKGVLEDLGFKIEEFGINTIVFKAHPTWLTKNFEGDNLRTIVDLVITNHKNFNKDRFLDSLAKMVSCKMSVKANEHLSLSEMEGLLNDLVKCDNPYNCCHGRPSIMKFTNYELEKMFKRVI
ncbi:MAG TPA: DNA mismatch repair endonuclease MutL [Candidatus Onthocola stercoravium]|nr:DNA mismatch repair endonuclease MutL [Candidatus Onthocola stercoravium]